MNWAQIAKLYRAACGGPGAAAEEALLHLNEGNRQVCSKLDLQELEGEETITLSEGDDYATLPTTIYHVRQMDNVTIGRRMEPEHAGMRGRSRFLASQSGQPTAGIPLYYAISEGRVFVRPKADGNGPYNIRIRAKMHPDEITESDWGSDPQLPVQYHMAVAHAAARSYFLAHPGVSDSEKQITAQLMANLRDSVTEKIAEPMLPKERERFDQRGRVYLRGFRFRK